MLADTIRALASLAWPAAVLVVALAYKPEILAVVPSALRRRFKLELPGGIKMEVDAVEQQKAAELAKADPGAGTIELQEIPGLARTPAIAKLERDLHEHLKAVTADPVHVLVRNLAQARLEAAFGVIYAGIFGSQIAGLVELQARRKVSAEEAFRFYQEFERRSPDLYVGYGFPGWLGFLRDRGLVAQVGEDVTMTDFGDDFLTWLRATRLSFNKAL